MLTTELTDAIELMFETGWTDGLPVVPPSEELVRRFVAHTGRNGDELIAELPPLEGRATVERIAVNAVMAGCVPEHMPVVITALQAMMDERFNLRGVMCSTGIHTPLLIVNGPAVQKLDINGGYNCFGAGWRGQRHHRPRREAGAGQPGWRSPRRDQQGNLRPPRRLHLLRCRGRGSQPVDADARRNGLRRRRQHRHRVPRRGAAQRHVPRLQFPRFSDRAGRHHVPPGQRPDVCHGRHLRCHRARARQVPPRRRLEQAGHPAVPIRARPQAGPA